MYVELVSQIIRHILCFSKLPPYTMSVFDLTTHSSMSWSQFNKSLLAIIYGTNMYVELESQIILPICFCLFVFLQLPPYTMAGFDLTTLCSSVLGGRQRRYHYVDPAARATSYITFEFSTLIE
jgi:hypothetical protein